MNNIVSFYSGTPFSVTASGTSLNAPENDQRADQVKSDVAILGGIGATSAYFDPLAFAPVTEARFGTAPFNVLRGPGVASWDLGIFRQFELPREMDLTIRMEAFNVTNRPRFSQSRGERVQPAIESGRQRRQSEWLRRDHRHAGRQRAPDTVRRASGLVVARRSRTNEGEAGLSLQLSALSSQLSARAF